MAKYPRTAWPPSPLAAGLHRGLIPWKIAFRCVLSHRGGARYTCDLGTARLRRSSGLA